MSIKTQEMNRQHPDDIKEIAYLVGIFFYISSVSTEKLRIKTHYFPLAGA